MVSASLEVGVKTLLAILKIFFYISILFFNLKINKMKNILLLIAIFMSIKSFSQDIMKKELNKKSNQVTVLVQGSYTVDSDVLKKFIREEQCPLFYSLDDSGIIRFDFFLDESKKTGTLIEVLKDSQAWEELGGKILGSPINVKFNELFKIEKITVLGDISEAWKTKIQAMNPIVQSYIGGIN